jgi:hypothetical protein
MPPAFEIGERQHAACWLHDPRAKVQSARFQKDKLNFLT